MQHRVTEENLKLFLEQLDTFVESKMKQLFNPIEDIVSDQHTINMLNETETMKIMNGRDKLAIFEKRYDIVEEQLYELNKRHNISHRFFLDQTIHFFFFIFSKKKFFLVLTTDITIFFLLLLLVINVISNYQNRYFLSY